MDYVGQLMRWRSGGMFDALDERICQLVAQTPFATTSQIAWVLFHKASGLVMARRRMRKLRSLGVMEVRRLALGANAGRPEDAYRMNEVFAKALGLVQAPFTEDVWADWVRADIIAQASWKRVGLGVTVRVADPPGDWPSSSATVALLIEHPTVHCHQFNYVVVSTEDVRRMVQDALRFDKDERSCGLVTECTSEFIGLEVTRSVAGNANRLRELHAVLEELLPLHETADWPLRPQLYWEHSVRDLMSDASYWHPA